MPKTTKVVTVCTERANYHEAVSSLQEKIETATQAICEDSNQKLISMSCTSMTKNHAHHAVHVLTAFILVEIDDQN